MGRWLCRFFVLRGAHASDGDALAGKGCALCCISSCFLRARVSPTSQALFGLEGLQGCGKTLLLKYLQCVIQGPNCARPVKNLAAGMTKEFFQEHINTSALYTDEIDQSIFDSDDFKSLCDDETGQAQLKHVNGVERFPSYIAIFASWNPIRKLELVQALLAGRGRRVIAAAVAAVLVSHGSGRKPGGYAGAEYFRGVLENQLNPWINANVHNFLMTGIHAPPSFNLQQFGGDSPEEVARLRSILLYSDLSLWDQFIKFFASLPESQLPAEGAKWSKYTPTSAANEQPIQTADNFVAEHHTHELSVAKHGLFREKRKDKDGKDEAGDLNYSCKPSFDAGAFAAVFSGIEEHGWQDGITIPAVFLKLLIDTWYKTRHPHDGKGKTTVAAAVLKDLADKKVLAADADDYYTLKRSEIAAALKAVGVAPPPVAHAWYDRERASNNKKLLAEWWLERKAFRGTSLRAFPTIFRLGGGAAADKGTEGAAAAPGAP